LPAAVQAPLAAPRTLENLRVIDVEGYEKFSLDGCDWSIEPRAIVLELDDAKTVPIGYGWQHLAGYRTITAMPWPCRSGVRQFAMGPNIAGVA
jgi:hypothetical protein